jgi:uncharacterized membrane protein
MTGRLAPLDITRGLAVLAMFVFHFTWDLGHFGHIDPAIPYAPAFKLFGHAIAAAFLFVAGVSLVLAHGRGFRAGAFWRRLALVGGAALLVTAATWFAFPSAFVFFGILHCVAAASLLALPLLFLPGAAALLAGAALVAAPLVARDAFFDAPTWWWTGLSTFEPLTNDYRPLTPWAGILLVGVGVARLARWETPAAPSDARPGKSYKKEMAPEEAFPPPPPGGRSSAEGAREGAPSPSLRAEPHPGPLRGPTLPLKGRVARPFLHSTDGPDARPGAAMRGLGLLGRHSLALYLLHQPLFFAAFSAAAVLLPAAPAPGFEEACRAQCVGAGGSEERCRDACACTAREVIRRNALAGAASEEERRSRVQAVARECAAK